MTRLKGRGVSSGTAIGRAVVAVRDARHVRYRIAASQIDRERQRLRSARARTRAELEDISARVAQTAGRAQAAIFAAQLLMLDDPLFARRVDDFIRTDRINADWALERVTAELQDIFARDGDVWLRERTGDLADVAGRLQRNLRPGRDPLVDLVQELEPPLIVVADDLPPSVAAQLDWTRVRAIVCDVGSPTHHTVILARSLGVPAVVGLNGATRAIAPGQSLAIDGQTGEVLIDPTDEELERWRARAEHAASAVRALGEFRGHSAATADGVRIRIDANLEIADEVARVRDAGAEGIGLYRSEFLLDEGGGDNVSEHEQVRVYRSLLEAMAPLPVTIRTFDAAGAGASGDPRDRRDRFGSRGVRSALVGDPRFRTQIRALLQSAGAGRLRILLPFVTSADEMRDARRLIGEIAREVGASADVPIGAMIELPAAALTVDLLAAQSDFLSVGTNDLIQYTLAADRTDGELAGNYEPRSPAVIRLLRLIAVAGRRSGKDLSVCGEIAAEPLFVALLVGLGFRALSMTPAAIPVTKRSLAALDSRQAAMTARLALRARSADEVGALLEPIAEALQKASVAPTT